MAQAKKKAATKTARKSSQASKKAGTKRFSYEKYQSKGQKSSMFFVISMSVLVATLLFADLIMINS